MQLIFPPRSVLVSFTEIMVRLIREPEKKTRKVWHFGVWTQIVLNKRGLNHILHVCLQASHIGEEGLYYSSSMFAFVVTCKKWVWCLNCNSLQGVRRYSSDDFEGDVCSHGYSPSETWPGCRSSSTTRTTATSSPHGHPSQGNSRATYGATNPTSWIPTPHDVQQPSLHTPHSESWRAACDGYATAEYWWTTSIPIRGNPS